MARVFFEDKFYEAPKGNTSLEFCANCNITHESCYGCPWTIVDMSQAVEISGITKEDCINYVKEPKKETFYLSTDLFSHKHKRSRYAMCYFSGKQLDGADLYMGVDFNGFVRPSEFGNGILSKIEEKANELRIQMSEFSDGSPNDDLFELYAYEHIPFRYKELSHVYTVINKNLLDIEIPTDVINECLDIKSEYTKKMYEFIKEHEIPVTDTIEHRGHTYKKYELGHFYVRNKFIDNEFCLDESIVYVRENDVDFHYGGLLDEDDSVIANIVKFEIYLKNITGYTRQVHLTDYPYEISKDDMATIIELANEMDRKIDDLVMKYID